MKYAYDIIVKTCGNTKQAPGRLVYYNLNCIPVAPSSARIPEILSSIV